MKRSWLAFAGSMALVLATTAAVTIVAATTASANDTPAGFWWGTDSTTVTIPGPAPYREPGIGGAYGGYIGMAGNWATWQHCGPSVVWSGADSGAADVDYSHHHEGIGTGVYWFMGGPGVDPHYNGTHPRGVRVGRRRRRPGRCTTSRRAHPGRPTRSSSWTSRFPATRPASPRPATTAGTRVYTSACSGRVKSHLIPAAVDRAEFNGYASYLTAHSKDKAGVYSAPEHLGVDLRHRLRGARSRTPTSGPTRRHQQPGPSPVGLVPERHADLRRSSSAASPRVEVRASCGSGPAAAGPSTASATSTRSTAAARASPRPPLVPERSQWRRHPTEKSHLA